MSSAFHFGTYNFSQRQKSQASLCIDFTEMQKWNLFLYTYLMNLNTSISASWLFKVWGTPGNPYMDALNPFTSKLMTLTLRGGLWTFSANLALCVATYNVDISVTPLFRTLYKMIYFVHKQIHMCSKRLSKTDSNVAPSNLPKYLPILPNHHLRSWIIIIVGNCSIFSDRFMCGSIHDLTF